MKRKLTAGQASVSLPIFVQDTSSTTGGGLSGLTSGTSGLVAEYRRRGQSSWTAITLTSKTLGTWTSGGIVADGALAGAYELDLPDAVCASGARWVAVRLRGAANMLPCLIEIELDAVDYQVDALGAVKPTTAGRTLTVDTSGNVVLQDGSLTATKIATDAITAAKIAADAVTEIQNGLATSTALASVASDVTGIKAKTDNLPADPADASDIAASFASIALSIATLTAYVDTEVAAIKAKTDNLPTDPADQSAVEAAITAAASLLATAAELAKVPKQGETRRYTQVAANAGSKTADVSIGAPL